MTKRLSHHHAVPIVFRVAVVALVFAAAGAAVPACGSSPGRDNAIGHGSGSDPDVGPYLVTERELENDGGRLYIPSTVADREDPGLFPLPFVVFIPGFSAAESDYRTTLRHVASQGFVVLGAKHGFDFVSAALCRTQRDGFDAVVRGIDAVELMARTPRHPLAGVIDAARPFATMGHSYGGKVALWLAVEGKHVGAVFALDPVDGGDERRPAVCENDPQGFPRLAPRLFAASMPPVAIIDAGRSGECAPAEGNGAVLFAGLSGEATRLHLPRATHTDFVDDAEDGDCFVCGLCPPSKEDAAEVLTLVRAGAVAFLRQHLLLHKTPAWWDVATAAVDGGSLVVERETR